MDAIDWEVRRRLDDAEVDAVSQLVDRVTAADGINPLSEHVVLHLRYGGDSDVRHVLAHAGDRLVGYAHLDVTDQVAGSSAEVAVDPAYRRQGVGQGLVRRAQAESPDGRLRLWSHGEESGAAPLAASLGFRRSRTLFQMRRSLLSALPEPMWADGVRLRSFLPGLDDDEWVALNARAFVDLPDQGSWTVDDLRLRMREPWFDPEGFLVAVEDGPEGERMLGFHWTKVHGADHHHVHEHGADELGGHHHHGDEPAHEHQPVGSGHHAHEPIGEVYVVGVDPSQQGRGLGRALTLAGLQHLRTRGLPDAMLYVDALNTSAIALYESLGFTRWDTDVEFSS
ncbi:MAG TPA: mycothiol synthase [Candidatus Nanopelagicales bacterium]|nr:mycothiol synthase [Candidatus Nanopelagicales bacterium]